MVESQIKRRGLMPMLMAHVGALICIGMWGVSFVSTKVLLEYMHPVEIYIYRFVLAYFLILLVKRTRWFAYNLRDEFLLCMCGMLSGCIYFLAENFALQYTLVTNVSLLTSMSPLITAFLIGFIYKTDKPGFGMILGSMVAFVGVGCIIFNSSFNMKVNPLGDLLAILAAFSWAFYSLVLKKLDATYDVWFISRKTFFYGVLTALPFLLVNPPQASLSVIFSDWSILGNLLFLGVGASLISYLLWARTVMVMGAVKANNYMYLQPVFTMVFSVICLGEVVTVFGYLGCALILGGLWLGDYLTRRSKMKS